MSIEAAAVLDHLAGSPQGRRLVVAVDGMDASGKTTFAEWLAEALRLRGRSAQVIDVDDFVHVRSVRHRRGRESSEGYFHDSYDYESLTRYVVEPLSVSGDGWFRAGTVDRVRDAVIRRPLQYADGQTITIVEGLFLLRDELVDWWDYWSSYVSRHRRRTRPERAARWLGLEPIQSADTALRRRSEDLGRGLPAAGARDMGPRQRRLEGSPTRRLIRAHRHDRTRRRPCRDTA